MNIITRNTANMTHAQLVILARHKMSADHMREYLHDMCVSPKAGMEAETFIEMYLEGHIPEIDLTSPELTSDDKRFLRSLKSDLARVSASHFDEVFGADTSSTMGLQIEIRGETKHDIYDHMPGYAFFERIHSTTYPVPAYTRRSDLYTVAEAIFRQVQDENGSPYEPYDGQFNAESMRIRNQAGEVLELFEKGAWIEESLSQSEWSTVLKEIENAEAQRVEEIRADNFFSAHQIDVKVEKLHTMLSLSKHKAKQCAKAA